MSFSITVVNPDEWEKKKGGRVAEELPPELVEVVRTAYADRKIRAVVVADDDVNKIVYQLRKAGHAVDCTVTVQQKPDQVGFTKLLFKAVKRQYRARKDS